MKTPFQSLAIATSLVVLAQGFASAQAPMKPSRPQPTVNSEAVERQYTFVVFYKQNDATTQTMAAALKAEIAKHQEVTAVKYVQVDDPSQKALVTKYDVSRAPLPLLVAVAPNGAMTGMFPKKLPVEGIDGVFVTPTMMVTMKALQEGKLVLVTVGGSIPAPTPVAVTAFQADPHYSERLMTVSMDAADPQEAKFIAQMKIPETVLETQTVLLAPPGVLVGKFSATASKEVVAAALAKAGKCCEDPNCKHQPAPQSATKTPAVRR